MGVLAFIFAVLAALAFVYLFWVGNDAVPNTRNRSVLGLGLLLLTVALICQFVITSHPIHT